MFTFHRSLWVTATFTALTLSLSGCAGCEFDEVGCTTDGDCRSGRVCGEDNLCVGLDTLPPDARPDIASDERPDLIVDAPSDVLPDDSFDQGDDAPSDAPTDTPLDVPTDTPIDQPVDMIPDQRPRRLAGHALRRAPG